VKLGMTGLLIVSLGATLLVGSGCQAAGSTAACCAPASPAADRPAELKRLDAMIGMWSGNATCTMPDGKTTSGTGKSCIGWEVDGNVLLERGEFTMDGQTMKGLGLWTWDASAKKYQLFWNDSMGAVSHGEARYDEASKTYSMNFRSRNSSSGESTVGEGTSRLVDANTMEWNWTEWDAAKTKKVMEMKGVSRRQ
jgi:Protein of unknown function (DUF1579)